MSQTPYPTCRQVKASGFLCGSPAMHDTIFCYHHQRDRQRKENIRRGLRKKFQNGLADFDAEVMNSLDLPAPEDPVAAGVCLSNMFLALASGVISTKRAAVMLYNLQIITSHFATVAKYRDDFEPNLKRTADAEVEMVTVAVTDPEPIQPVGETQDASAQGAELDRYTQVLEVAEIPVPDPDSAYRQFEDEHTEMLHDFAEALLVPEGDKQEWLELLESDYLEERKRGRQRIVEKVYSQMLDARYASPKESAAAHSSQSQVAGSQNEREEQIA